MRLPGGKGMRWLHKGIEGCTWMDCAPACQVGNNGEKDCQFHHYYLLD